MTTQYRVTAYDWVPEFAQGLVRDLRVRWALREAGKPYEVTLLAQGSQTAPDHLSRQPFGQVPVLECDGTGMFESGAILWRIAQDGGDALLPADPEGRDGALSWLFAALNTVEPPVSMIAMLFFSRNKDAAETLRPEIRAMVERRLGQLAAALGTADWLVGNRFTVADIAMVTVLRSLRGSGLVEAVPVLDAYVTRATRRPAFCEALAEQMAAFAENAPRYARPKG